MFSTFTEQLRAEIETIKSALETHDRFRSLVFAPVITSTEAGSPTEAASLMPTVPEDSAGQVQQQLEEIRDTCPSKASWQVYDHCAAFTRLYAVYEQFVDELISDYLRILPELYEKYEDLPEDVTRQHRLGIAQILLKLGKDGPYRHLEEKQVIADLAHGVVGGADYKLLRDAFLIDPRNYRVEVLIKLFGDLGIRDCWSWVEKHPLVIAFMQRERDSTETAATVLNGFVEYRNKAAHTTVAETVATDEVKSIADCVMVICESLAQLVMKQVIRRREELDQISVAGEVLHKFSNSVMGAKMHAGAIAVGDDIVVMHKHVCHKAKVTSIHIENVAYERLDLNEGQEVGLQLTSAANVGALLMKTRSSPSIPQEAPEAVSPDEFPIPDPGQVPPTSEAS